MVRRPNPNLPHLESLSRIYSIPLVESGCNYAGSFYTALKRSNSLTNWSCEKAEMSIHLAVDNALPIAVALVGNGPISAVDKMLCKSLDILDKSVPSIYLPPQMVCNQNPNLSLKNSNLTSNPVYFFTDVRIYKTIHEHKFGQPSDEAS